MYKDSFVPHDFPGGGGFSVMKFTLSNLYSMHQYCSNWWTQSNQDLPLTRYFGCKIKCYQSQLIDYIVRYSITIPATSNKLTYPATQPSMMMMSHQKKIIPSKKTRTMRKPYRTINIRPPAQLQNKWYFQKDIRETPLLVLYVTPTSLNNYYINPDADNNNITITSLNTLLVNNRNFNITHWPFKVDGTKSLYFWEYSGTANLNDPSKFLNKHLTPLTNITHYTIGCDYEYAKRTYHTSLQEYCTQIPKYTGNPFTYQHRVQNNFPWFMSETGPQTWADKYKTLPEDSTVAQINNLPGNKTMQLTLIHEPLIKEYRYNPFRDDGKTTQMYLLKNTVDEYTWEPPQNPDIILEGFPMWLNIWGYVDFQIRLGTISQIMTKSILVIKNRTTKPETTAAIVPIDLDYLNNKSPYENSVNTEDKNRWYPQVQFQTQQMNNIALTGPGTPKLPQKTSEQVVIKYDFHFKWGGNPAKMINVSNPSKQPVYPLPSDECTTNSLQSPAQAIENNIYSFDERHNQLTKQALKRISEDWDFTKILSSITEPTGLPTAQGTYPQETQTQTTTEKEKEEILQQLFQHRLHQQQLRLRIINLMKELDL